MCNTDGEIQSIQTIAPDGRKLFHKGGTVKGFYYSIGKPTDNIVIAEGYATGATIHEATGYGVVVAFNAGNISSVAQAVRGKYPDADIIIAGDNDQHTDGNPGVTKATEAAEDINALLAIPQFKDTSTNPTDYNDLARLDGADIVRHQIDGATEPAAADKAAVLAAMKQSPEQHLERLIAELAALSPMEYEQRRKAAAKELDWRTSVLDAEVGKVRSESEPGEDCAQGTRLTFPKQEPWPDPVDGAELLNELATLFERHVVLPDHAADALALWVLHSHTHETALCLPAVGRNVPSKAVRENHATWRPETCCPPPPIHLQYLSCGLVQDGGGLSANFAC